MSNPQAYLDCLFIADRMTDLVGGFSRAEQHLFSYASCLLSLYEGQPCGEWGYEFVSTTNGLPFATQLDEAIEAGHAYGYFFSEGSLSKLTAQGREELAIWTLMEGNHERLRYLAGATDALLVFSPGNVREAFDYDPAIKFLKDQQTSAWMLEQPIVDRLYTNFQEIRRILADDTRDLSLPLITWLKYLITVGRKAAHAN
jgi:hypothetical protein